MLVEMVKIILTLTRQYSPKRLLLLTRLLHENMSRFFSLLLPCLDARTDDMEVPDRRFFGAMPQYEARWSWSGKSSIRMATTSSEAVLGPIPGTVSRHAYVPSSASSPAMAPSMRDASSLASLIRLASVMTCGFSASCE